MIWFDIFDISIKTRDATVLHLGVECSGSNDVVSIEGQHVDPVAVALQRPENNK